MAIIDAWENSGLSQKIFEKLKNLRKIGGKIAKESYISNAEDFNVLMHGDCWSNNFMYNYDYSGKVKDVRIVCINSRLMTVVSFP